MQLTAIGDIHGNDKWKQIVKQSVSDKIVFIGDYFDTLDPISPTAQKNNFEAIIKFKKDNPGRVVLLFGNHDYHYLRSVTEEYSGFQAMHQHDYSDLLHAALKDDLMQICFKHNSFLFSHAGISQTWFDAQGLDKNDIENSVNTLFHQNAKAFGFTPGRKMSPYGDEKCQTPIWIRPNSLLDDLMPGYTQVVGHTVVKKLAITEKLTLIDTLTTSGEFLMIDNGVMRACPAV